MHLVSNPYVFLFSLAIVCKFLFWLFLKKDFHESWLKIGVLQDSSSILRSDFLFFFFLSLLHNTKLVSQLVNLSYPWNTHLPLAVSNPKKFLLFYPFFCSKILLILHQKYLKIYISSILSSKTLFVVPFIFFARYLKPVGECVVAFCC